MTAESKPGINPVKAMWLSLVVLPGLGQILTGFKVRGWIMIAAILIWLVWAGYSLFNVYDEVKTALTIMAESRVYPQAGELARYLIGLVLPGLIIWGWAGLDSFVALCRSDYRDQRPPDSEAAKDMQNGR